LRNLTHVDLYDNFGFAHDLVGQHNSCRCYIRATPRSRAPVGSPFALEILQRFGVGSCSVNFEGRKDPYAMVNALFNAVKKHDNLDDIAKSRGRRYLTLKWAYDNNI
jgi:ribosomal protein S5